MARGITMDAGGYIGGGSMWRYIVYLLLCLSPCRAVAAEPLVIGVVPEMNVFKQMARYEPLGKYLAEKMGREVKITIKSPYGNIVDRLRERKIDGAFLGAFTGALAITQLGEEPLARPVNPDGNSTECGCIFVRKDRDIQSVEQMRGKNLALVEKATASGYVFPVAYFRRYGVDDLGTYFQEVLFVGSHDATIMAVLDGDADVGAAKSSVFDRLNLENPRIKKELTILATSHPVPSNGLCVRPDLPNEVKQRLKTLLLKLHLSPEGGTVLERLGALRFEETTRADYQPVFDLAKDAGIQIENYKYYNQ